MVLLVYLLTQNITCIFRNLVLIFVHGCKNLFCTKIHCVWQAAPGDRTPSRRVATPLHWAVLLVQQGYIQLFQCFSFLTRLAHWPFSTKKRVLFLNYLVPVSPRCLALLFQLGELSTTYFTSWAAGFITWAPWGQLPVPRSRHMLCRCALGWGLVWCEQQGATNPGVGDCSELGQQR